jgi:purine-nucleoside phosphorylase
VLTEQEIRWLWAACDTIGQPFGPLAKMLLLTGARLREVARGIDSSLDEGVYCQFRGPHYETPAEVQMAKAIGGHIVGMSTALEAIAARQAGMEVLGMSLITNLAAGIQKSPLSHGEVLEAGQQAEAAISALLAKIVAAL